MSRCPAWDWEVPFSQRCSADRTRGLACTEQAVSQYLLQLPLSQGFVQCELDNHTRGPISVFMLMCSWGWGGGCLCQRRGLSLPLASHKRGNELRLY